MELQLLGKEKEMEQLFQKQRRVSSSQTQKLRVTSIIYLYESFLALSTLTKCDAKQNADNILMTLPEKAVFLF